MRRLAQFAGASLAGAAVWVLIVLTNFAPLKIAALWPGFAFGPIVARYIPETLAYALAPNGGPGAMIAVILVVSFVFWALTAGTASLAVSSAWRGRNRNSNRLDKGRRQ